MSRSIILASLNKTKQKAVVTVFNDYHIKTLDLPSDVGTQPMTDLETRTGAINRAKHAWAIDTDVIGIGLEGGIMIVEDELYLCNWGALITSDKQIITAAGARIRLPNQFKAEFAKGKELSEIMNVFTSKEDIRNQEGAIGIFTNNEISRTDLFIHIVKMLKGQMDYQL